jgi:hypothetical protein
MGMKVDRLFLERDCPHCGAIRGAINMDAVSKDHFRGPKNQAFHVFSAQSNQASLELLEKFGITGKYMPVLVTHEGEVIEKPRKILAHLKSNGMAQ